MMASVVIPVYNVAPCLNQCLHSVVDEADADVEAVRVDGLRFEHVVHVENKPFQGKALLRATRMPIVDAPVCGYSQREGSVMHTNLNRDNFGAELAWHTKRLQAMSASGKAMDRKLWRYTSLCLLKYMPCYFHDIPDPALGTKLTRHRFDTIR